MAFESKRFCFNLNCNKTEDDYKDINIKKEKIKLQLCSNCKIAEFCGKTCQEQAWKEGHKKWCLSINNPKKFHYLHQDKKYRIPKDRSGKPAAIIMDSRNCYLMSVHFKSYHGVELILSQYLNQILLGPPHLTKRYMYTKYIRTRYQHTLEYIFIKKGITSRRKCSICVLCNGITNIFD